MATELRKTGINVVGDIPWGTHFCFFYETKRDLLDVAVPYFKVGLENNEFCLWVISVPPDLLTMEEATTALRYAMPDLDRYLAEGSIEIVSRDQWFLDGDTYELRRIIERFVEKLNQTLARGYAGMRVNGGSSWLLKNGEKDLHEFEEELDQLIVNQRMIVSCNFLLAETRSNEIFDVASTHQFAIARRNGNWNVLETQELKQAKAEIKRLNDELEQRVAERTRELVAANEALKSEIDERSRVEVALRDRAADLAEAQRVAKIGNWSFDLRTNQVVWSEELHRIFETDENSKFDDRHESFVSRVHPDDQPLVLRTNAQARTQGLPFEIEYRIITSNDNVRIIREIGYATQDETGQVIRLFGTAQDITERKQAEALLHAKEQEFRAIVENAPDQIIRYDRDFRRIYINPAVANAYGLPAEALTNKPIGSVIQDVGLDVNEDELAQIRQRIADVFDTGESYVYEVRFPIPTGPRHFSVRLFPELDLNGSVINVLAIARDITEQKRAEEKLKATSEQLRALSARLQSAREEEGARIARELHDELGSALTGLKWDLESIDKLCSEAGIHAESSKLHQKLIGMMGVIDATLNAVLRISSELRPTILDDLGLLEAVEWLSQQFEARTGIVCQIDSFVEKVDLSREKATAVFRILQEALTNVLRHARASSVNITISEEAGAVVFEIRDNGRGITEDEKAGSRSLGLIGMRERAHLVEGRIEIASVGEKGTVLTLRVPVQGQDSD